MNDLGLVEAKTLSSSLESILSFLDEIGIAYYVTEDDFSSFLSGVRIDKGKLKINVNRLICIGDILHEAGHLACVPEHLRPMADDDISKSLGEEYTVEMGVIAWSVAAALHLDIPLSDLFHSKGYNGEADWLLEKYNDKYYIGLPLLQWMGMAAREDELVDHEILPYPHMLRWTRK